MKLFALLALVTLSSEAYSQTCYVDMIVKHTGRVVRSFSGWGDSSCMEGMKECRKSIRFDFSNHPQYPSASLDCVRAGGLNPAPNPNPYPNPNPGYPNPGQPNPGYPNPGYPNPGYPNPGYSYDARRILKPSESVIYNGKFVTVIGSNYAGTYAVRSTDGWNSLYNNVPRESLSVTEGCSMDLCTSASVINVKTLKYVKVAGVSFHDSFAVLSIDGWNSLSMNIDRNDLAKTEGCVGTYYSQICTGMKVLTAQNRYATVAGVQLNGRLVLRSNDGWNSLTANVDPSYLVITN